MADQLAVPEALARIKAATPEDRAGLYIYLLSGLASGTRPDEVCAVAESVFGAGLGVVAGRAVLAAFIAALRRLGNREDKLWVRAGSHALDLAGQHPQQAAAEQSAALRELVAEGHEAAGDYHMAACVLAAVSLDGSGGQRVSDSDRARVWVRVARLFLEADDSTAAESFVNKLKSVMHAVDDPELQLHFRLSQARILDARREFLAAATGYHAVSQSADVAEDERLHTLAMAIKCAVLAPAGPLRRRLLARLYRDERAVNLSEFAILESMYLDRLLSSAEAARFAATLMPHQMARTSDGSTVVARSVAEHNLHAASQLYENISFEDLATLLGLADDERAEEATALMIQQGRLLGRIDQVDRRVWFERGEASGEKGSGQANRAIGREMSRWDSNVQRVAEDLEKLTDMLQSDYPNFAAVNLIV